MDAHNVYAAPLSVAPERLVSENVIDLLPEYTPPVMTPANAGAVVSIVNLAHVLLPTVSDTMNV